MSPEVTAASKILEQCPFTSLDSPLCESSLRLFVEVKTKKLLRALPVEKTKSYIYLLLVSS